MLEYTRAHHCQTDPSHILETVPKSERSLGSVAQEVARADWATPSDVNARFRSASMLQGNRIAFNIAGNHYRLIVKINYPYRVIYIRFIGSHTDYDTINVTTI